jgi:hypothetical protein
MEMQRVTLRLRKTLVTKLQRMAKQRRTSISRLLVVQLEEELRSAGIPVSTYSSPPRNKPKRRKLLAKTRRRAVATIRKRHEGRE